MRNMKRVALLGSAAMAAVVALTGQTAMAAGTSAAAAPTAPYTAIVVNGTNAGGSFVRDAATNTFTMTGSRTVLQLQGNGAPNAPFATLSAVNPVVVGDLAVDATNALRLNNGAGQECVVTGTLHVTEVTFGADDVATSFAADYSGTCASGQASSGQIRFNSAADYQGLDLTASATWTAPFVGERNAPTVVTATARGTGTTAISAVNTDDPNFVTLFGTDSCSGATLANEQSCTVTVAAGPRALTPAAATGHLSFATSQPTSPVSTALSYTGAQLSKRGQYFPTNARVMDTRSGLGVRKGVVAGGTSVSLPVAGKNGVPATGVSAAVFNVTVTGATASSFGTVYPGGTTRPGTSNLNFGKGFTGANLVTVPLGANGAVNFFNGSGSVNFVADLVGYYSATPTFSKSGGNDFYSFEPVRVFDSRSNGFGLLGPAEYFDLPIDFGDPAFEARVRGLVITLTAANANANGFLSVTPTAPTGPPTTSSLNYQAGPPVANLVAGQTTQTVVTGGTLPTVFIANSSASSTHVIVDIVGVFAQEVAGDEGLRFKPITPERVLDTRSDLGAATVGTNVDTFVPVPPTVAGRDTFALAGNLTGVLPTANTFLTVWGGGARPGVSSVNLTKGVTRANAAWTGVTTTNAFGVYNKAGTTETLYDVSGTFEAWPASPETIAGIPFAPAPGVAKATPGVKGTGGAGSKAPSTVGPVRGVGDRQPQHY